MFNTTLSYLKCPRRKKGKKEKNLCHGSLRLFPKRVFPPEPSAESFEVSSGHLECQTCRSRFPILAGVAILVHDVREYLLQHVKGVAQSVPDSEIPEEYRGEFAEARSEIESEHIEEDLEAERVNALYVMNHYLRVENQLRETWWKPRSGSGSPLIESLIETYWDRGPFNQIKTWVKEEAEHGKSSSRYIVELGCGVGGLCPLLKPYYNFYLGVDSSFASIALARHLALGFPYRGAICIPEDLLQGPVSRPLNSISRNPHSLLSPASGRTTGLPSADFIVTEIESPPLEENRWDLSITLNMMDMLDEPALLPALQYQLLKKNGMAIQSCPYIWHPEVAKKLQKNLPNKIRGSSSEAAEWLYEQAGLKIEKSVKDIPWLFYKHIRQLEIYSVHAFVARKN